MIFIKKFGKIVVISFFTLVLGLVSGCDLVSQPGLDDAMQRYLEVIRNQDTAAFLDFISDTGTFRFSSYNGGSGNLMTTEIFSKEEVKKNLDSEGGLYFALFGGTAAYKYRDRVDSTSISDWSHNFTVYSYQTHGMKTYVKWAREGSDWKIVEIGDSLPASEDAP